MPSMLSGMGLLSNTGQKRYQRKEFSYLVNDRGDGCHAFTSMAMRLIENSALQQSTVESRRWHLYSSTTAS